MSNPFDENYGVQKTPIQLIEEFVTQMMIDHHVFVTGINLSEQSDLDKVVPLFGTPPEGLDLRRVVTSAGPIALRVKKGF